MASYADERQARIADQGKGRFVPAGKVLLGSIINNDIDEARLLLDLNLKDERSQFILFQTGWKNAKDHVEKHNKSDTEDMKILKTSVLLYTSNKPMSYELLNQQCRDCIEEGKTLDGILFNGWLYTLYIAVRMLPPSPSNTEPSAEIKCYRGVTGYHEEPTLVGSGPVCFNQVGSTSTDVDEAMKFTKENGTLYEIDRIPAYALGIEGYSYHPSEKEVLVFPSSVFNVLSVEKEEGVNITRVKLAIIQ